MFLLLQESWGRKLRTKKFGRCREKFYSFLFSPPQDDVHVVATESGEMWRYLACGSSRYLDFVFIFLLLYIDLVDRHYIAYPRVVKHQGSLRQEIGTRGRGGGGSRKRASSQGTTAVVRILERRVLGKDTTAVPTRC